MPRIIEDEPDTIALPWEWMGLWDAFREGFRRSRRGNLWREYRGCTLTVFQRRDDCFGWCLATGEATHFSRFAWDTEELALSALYDAVLAEYNEN